MINLKKNGKKGFTLAELLIVVAIIAVLTAIAVPLFVGALNNAEKSVENANIRAVRGTAVAAILGDSKFGKVGDDDAKFWSVTATVSPTGEVSITKIVPATSKPEFTTECKKSSTTGVAYDVTVLVESNDLKNISAS